MPAAERQAALDRLSGRAPPLPVVRRDPPPRLQHCTTRPVAQPLPAEPIRVTRSEIEAAQAGGHTYNPHAAEIIDRVLLEQSRMDQHSAGSEPFRAHHETIMRLLRQISLYPVPVPGN